jgi:hypothetical protein
MSAALANEAWTLSTPWIRRIVGPTRNAERSFPHARRRRGDREEGFSAMPSVTLGKVGAGAAAASAACLVWLCLSTAPATAGDDGAAPLWVGIGSVFGFGGDEEQPDIEYRDHAKLVVPPKTDLPAPAPSPWASATDWPRDPDVARWKADQAEKNKNKTFIPKRDSHQAPDPHAVVTTNYTSGVGSSLRGKCTVGPGESCDSAPSPQLNWNPLTWVGIQKKPVTVLGPEPSRTSLTDPPPGFRAPAEGAGVKVDTN